MLRCALMNGVWFNLALWKAFIENSFFWFSRGCQVSPQHLNYCLRYPVLLLYQRYTVLHQQPSIWHILIRRCWSCEVVLDRIRILFFKLLLTFFFLLMSVQQYRYSLFCLTSFNFIRLHLFDSASRSRCTWPELQKTISFQNF
mgnify:CR=1 FL=1